MLFRFERLVQAFGITPSRHHTAGKLVNNHHFIVADDVILVPLEQRVRAQRLIDVMHERGIGRIIEASLFQKICLRQQFLDLHIAGFS